MAANAPNPYMPPRDGPPIFTSNRLPLPPGFRRFHLDPVQYGPFVTGVMLRRLVPFGVLVVVALLAFNAALGVAPASVAVQIVFTVGFLCTLRVARRRSATANELRAYELLLGPRVLRRTGFQMGPVEILRPELTQIAETRDGLWLSSHAPLRSLFVARAVDGYADVRAELATWRSIESVRGWAAWRLTSKAARRQGPRGAVLGTALASDASLHEELETARAASASAHWESPAPRNPLVQRGLWVVLILMFVGIWVFLTPTPPTPAPNRGAHPAGGAR